MVDVPLSLQAAHGLSRTLAERHRHRGYPGCAHLPASPRVTLLVQPPEYRTWERELEVLGSNHGESWVRHWAARAVPHRWRLHLRRLLQRGAPAAP